MGGDLLNLGDVERLVLLTAERAKAEQESAACLRRILALLEAQNETLQTLTERIIHVEGVSVALGGFLAKRNGDDLDRLHKALDKAERDPAVSVYVDQQAGGARTGDLEAKSDRDLLISGGNIDKE